MSNQRPAKGSPLTTGERVGWSVMTAAYVVAIGTFAVLWFGGQDPRTPVEPGQQTTPQPAAPVEQVDACRALLDYASEHGIPTGPNDPSYVEWQRLDEACEATK